MSTPTQRLPVPPFAEFWDRKYATPTEGWTWHVSQRLGALLAYSCARLGLSPNKISVLSVVSAAAAFGVATIGHNAAVFAGIAILWQLGYAFDCADGQVARAMKAGSDFGARFDVACDLAAKTAQFCTIYYLYADLTPRAVTPLIVSGWLLPLLWTSLQNAAGKGRAERPGRLRRLISLALQSVDAGVQLVVLAVGIAISKTGALVAVLFIIATSLGFVGLQMVVQARALRRP